MPIIISGQPLAAAWEHWQESHTQSDGLKRTGPIAADDRVKQKNITQPALHSEDTLNPSSGISVSLSAARVPSGSPYKIGSFQRHSQSAKAGIGKSAAQVVTPMSSAAELMQGSASSSVLPVSDCQSDEQAASGRMQVQQGQCSTSQRTAASQALLQSIHMQPRAQSSSASEKEARAHDTAAMADCVVAVCFDGGWASGVVVHSSGTILTVAHAVRPSDDAESSHGSIQPSYVRTGHTKAEERLAEAEDKAASSKSIVRSRSW